MTLELTGLTKRYGKGHTEVIALNNVSLSVQPGEIVLVIGPSGSGKTTLLTMVGGLLRPTGGKVRVGEELFSALRQPTSAWRRRHVGFIFQSFNLISSLTALQNVMLPLLSSGWSKKKAKSHAELLLARLELEPRMKSLPKNLSGGEKQRVAIARALANDPDILLADEPTANLDSKIGREVARILCEIACEQGKIVIIVSHDPRLRDIATKVITIEDGKLTGDEVGGHARTCRMGSHPGLKTAS